MVAGRLCAAGTKTRVNPRGSQNLASNKQEKAGGTDGRQPDPDWRLTLASPIT